MDDDYDCLGCGYCRFCIDRSIATAEEMEAAEADTEDTEEPTR